MAGDEGKKVNRDDGSSLQIKVNKTFWELPQFFWHFAALLMEALHCNVNEGKTSFWKLRQQPQFMQYVNPCKVPRMWGTTTHDQVSEEETAAAFVYKMDKTWLMPDEVRVEIRRGHALWVIGQGDEPVKVELPSNDKMRVSEAMASMNADGVLTVVIPKRHGPRKWYEYKDLVLAWFTTVRVAVSS